MKNKERKNNVSMASLYHRCEKYNEMIQIAKDLIKEDPNLEEMEMSVFTEGYKCKLNEIRKALIKLLEIEKTEKQRGSTHVHLMKEIINPKIKELSDLCDDFNSQIDILISKPKNFDIMANLSRLKLDFLRYKCQFIEKGEEWQKTHDEFFNVLKRIESIGNEFLAPNNINILYIQLNKCVFYYEILNKTKEAIEMGKNLLKSVLEPPPPPQPKPEPKKEMTEDKLSKASVVEDDSKKTDKKEETKKTKTSGKKKSSAKLKEEKKDVWRKPPANYRNMICSKYERTTDNAGIISFQGYKFAIHISDNNSIAKKKIELCVYKNGIKAFLGGKYYSLVLKDKLQDGIGETMSISLRNIIAETMLSDCKQNCA